MFKHASLLVIFNVFSQSVIAAGTPLAPSACEFERNPSNAVISWNPANKDNADKYIVERRRDGGNWYWAGAQQSPSSSFVNTDLTLNSTYQYRVLAKNSEDLKSGVRPCSERQNDESGERQQTARVNNRWEIVDTESGSVVHWRAVNVRTDKLLSQPLGMEDLQAIAERFDTIRLSMHWDQIEPQNDSYAQPLVAAIEQLLDQAEALGIDVILDPVHLGGKESFWIPQWVWNTELPGVTPSKGRSFPILGSQSIRDYFAWVMRTLGSHEAVVAIEAVNEPHPQDSKDAWRPEKQTALLNNYASIIDVIRTDRPNIIVVLGSYYGGHLFNSGQTPYVNTIRDMFANTPNLVWTAHNYFTGIEQQRVGPDYDQDGTPDLDGQGFRGARGAGTWTESFTSAGCYTEAGTRNSNTEWTCDPNLTGRGQAMQGHANNAVNHDRIAQEANMPFFMGEWGMSRVRQKNIDGDAAQEKIGWGGTREFMCDKQKAYQDIYRDGSQRTISWAVWAFDARVDGGFGLYDGSTNAWVAETSDAFAPNSGCRN